MRFHSALVGTKSKVKVLGINYDIKVLNLAKHIGFPIIGLDKNDLEKDFDDLINSNTENYNIPNFEFPEL
jgi:polysaccharide pyruvyl transferase WcaK-like protein